MAKTVETNRHAAKNAKSGENREPTPLAGLAAWRFNS
jgi:hypothetical protein